MSLKTCFRQGSRLTISLACVFALYITSEDLYKHPEPGLRNAVPVLLALDRLANSLQKIDSSDDEKRHKPRIDLN